MTGGLRFEHFPRLALVRTYCADHTVADSACSATAYLCGVKGNKDTVGVRAGVEYEVESSTRSYVRGANKNTAQCTFWEISCLLLCFYHIQYRRLE